MKRAFQSAASGLACITMMLSPVAQGAQAKVRNEERIRAFLQVYGFVGEKRTVGEFYERIRQSYPEKWRAQIDAWVIMHKNDPMPTVTLQPIKDKKGDEQFRIVFERDGQTFNIETADDHVKFGSIQIGTGDLDKPQGLIDRVLKADPYFARAYKREPQTYDGTKLSPPSYEQFVSMSIEQRAVYFLQMRRGVEQAEKILGPSAKVRSSFLYRPLDEAVARWLFGADAGAANIGDLPANDTGSGSAAPPADLPAADPNPKKEPKKDEKPKSDGAKSDGAPTPAPKAGGEAKPNAEKAGAAKADPAKAEKPKAETTTKDDPKAQGASAGKDGSAEDIHDKEGKLNPSRPGKTSLDRAQPQSSSGGGGKPDASSGGSGKSGTTAGAGGSSGNRGGGGSGTPIPPSRPKTLGSSETGGGKEVRGARVGGSCIVAGYKSTYGENFSCGGETTGRADFTEKINRTFHDTFPKASQCSGGSYPCNPLVYGFDDNGGPHCIASGKPLQHATEACNQASPLNGADDMANKLRIVKSWLKAKGKDTTLKLDEKGEKLDQESYEKIKGELADLQDYIRDAVGFCDAQETQKLLKAREEQKSACDAIRVRAFALEAFAPKPAIPDCVDKEGSQPVETSKGKFECVCAEGTQEIRKRGKVVCEMAVVEPPPKKQKPYIEPEEEPEPALPKHKKEKEECSGLFCGTNWLLPLLMIGGIGLFVWWMTKDNGIKQPYVNYPAGYAPPGYVPPPTTTTPTIPVVPPAATEGGSGVSPINSGGVRSTR